LQAAEAHGKAIVSHQQNNDPNSSMEGSSAALPELKASNRDLLVLSVGIAALLFVPVFKQLTGLPPYLGMLSGLAVLWLVTDALHFGEDKQYPQVQDALRNLDIAGEAAATSTSIIKFPRIVQHGCMQVLPSELSVGVAAVSVACISKQEADGCCTNMSSLFATATGVMFFFGILMSVEALNAAGLLAELAEALAKAVPNVDVIAG
jgi:Na+/H+ antiporter NhaD/arsenite permease-like protein